MPNISLVCSQAEILMLKSYCEKAQLADGIDILGLDRGWGSLSMYLAQKYPNHDPPVYPTPRPGSHRLMPKKMA